MAPINHATVQSCALLCLTLRSMSAPCVLPLHQAIALLRRNGYVTVRKEKGTLRLGGDLGWGHEGPEPDWFAPWYLSFNLKLLLKQGQSKLTKNWIVGCPAQTHDLDINNELCTRTLARGPPSASDDECPLKRFMKMFVCVSGR